MVLGREDDTLHPGLPGDAGPLLTVQAGGCKDVRVLLPRPPLAVRKRVGAEMYEHVVLHPLPLDLRLRGHGTVGSGDGAVIARSRHRECGDGCQDNIYSSHIAMYDVLVTVCLRQASGTG